MGQKVPGPLGDTGPPKGQPLKFQKSLTPRKYTTSKFSRPTTFRGVHTLRNYQQQI